MQELIEIQTKLVAPKNQTNTFGNYKYRNLESIMEAVKPLLKEWKCTITFTDDLVMLGERIFCKSTATIKNSKGEMETASSFAELDNHKGMSKEQASGSSSSYSRKYAICSLLAIDDNQDIDSMDNTYKVQPTPYTETNTNTLKTFCSNKKTEAGVNKKELLKFWEHYSARAESWKGNFDVPALYQKWMNGKN